MINCGDDTINALEYNVDRALSLARKCGCEADTARRLKEILNNMDIT